MLKTKTHTPYTPSALQKAFEAYGSAIAIGQFLESRGSKPFPFTFAQFIKYNTPARQEWEKMKKRDEPTVSDDEALTAIRTLNNLSTDGARTNEPKGFVPSHYVQPVFTEKRAVEFIPSPMGENVFPEKRKQPRLIKGRDGSWTVESEVCGQ